MNALQWPCPAPVRTRDDEFIVRLAVPEDAGSVAALMSDPQVDEWWHQDWGDKRWRHTLTELLASPHAVPLVVCDRGSTVVGYVELYRVTTDVLGAHVSATDTDLGVHLALGDAARGRRLGRVVIDMVASVSGQVLPGCSRLMAEPDHRNHRSHRAFERAGFERAHVIELPDKRALLMLRTIEVASSAVRRTNPDDGEIVDIAAIGAGPFNLGLAALADTVSDLSLVCFDREAELTWHRGLMVDGALLQVSFLADLVTLVDPTHPLSFLAYLRDQGRIYQFYVREKFHPTRQEYEDYLRWVTRQLPGVRFGHSVETVHWDNAREIFEITVAAGRQMKRFQARHLVLGVGTGPVLPKVLHCLSPDRLVHSGNYLHRIDDILDAGSVTVVGSGQSGAECFLDLLRREVPVQRLSWLTRTATFAPLDYTKLVLEMTTPTYVDHFHSLPEGQRDDLVAEQWRHYKGISTDTLEDIHDALYARGFREKSAAVELRTGVSIVGATGGDEVVLEVEHRDTGTTFRHRSDLVVAATGYALRPAPLDEALRERLHHDDRGRLRLHRNHAVSADGVLDRRVFVANADLHSHGPAAPDLGIGAVRNASIINAVTGRECYPLPRNTAFTSFTPVTTANGASE